MKDKRQVEWQVRIRLYDLRAAQEPVADSDPDLEPDLPGRTTTLGLGGAAGWLALTAAGFHKADGPVVGLEMATLTHRLKGLRPTLSRRGGNATWRVPYTVGGLAWLARVDIQHAETGPVRAEDAEYGA